MTNSTNNDYDRTSQQLKALARQNRLLWGLVAILGFLVVSTSSLKNVVADSIPPVVEAQRFVLKDSNGKVRGEWALQSDGKLRLVVFKDNGKVEAEFPAVPGPIPAGLKQ